MESEILGKVAGVVAISSFVPYIYSTIKGKTKPNRASWLIWAVLGGLLFTSYLASGATTTIWLPLSFAIGPIVIFLLSIKRGIGGYNRLDIICLTGAALGLVLWLLTNNSEVALYLNIFVDALAFLPTFKKAYLQPGTENKLAWGVGTTATLLNVLAINSWEYKIALYPVYLFIFNATVLVLLLGTNKRELRSAKN